MFSKKSFLLVFLLFTFKIFSQNDSVRENRKYVAYYSPSDATEVNGLMFNFWLKDLDDIGVKYPRINGIEVDLNLANLIVTPMAIVHTLLDSTSRSPLTNRIDTINYCNFKQINGLHVGLGNMENSVNNGLGINLGASCLNKTNGVILSVVNKNYEINGLSIGLIFNGVVNCNGIQIGLINNCKKLKGFQFGLWNKNQKRSLPFINWSFGN